MREHKLALLAFAVTAVTGCDEDYSTDAPPVTSAPSVQVHDGAWLLQFPGSDDIHVVRRSGAAVDHERLELGRPIRELVPVSDGRLLALDTEEPRLFVLREGQAAPQVVTLGTVYDRVTPSPDGRFAIAWFSPSSNGPAGSILFNPNAISVIDLQANPPTVRELRLSGPRPQWIQFSPELTFADPDDARTFAVVAGASAISLVDLTTTDAADQQRLIRLSDPASSVTLSPQSVVFSSDDPSDPNDVFAFVLAWGSPELFAINLLPADPSTGRMLQPAINQLALPGQPVAMYPYEVAGTEKLLVTTSAAALGVVDVATGNVTTVTTDRQLNQALTYTLESTGGARPEAILYRRADRVVFFADLTTIERQGSGALRARPIAGAVDLVSAVDAVAGSRQRAIAHYTGGGGLSVLDLELRSETPVPSRLALGDYAIAGDYFYTVVAESARMAVLGLGDDGVSVEVDLPAAGSRVVPLPASNAVLVTHPGDSGWFSVLAMEDLAGGPIAEFRGIAYEGYLDRSEGGDE